MELFRGETLPGLGLFVFGGPPKRSGGPFKATKHGVPSKKARPCSQLKSDMPNFLLARRSSRFRSAWKEMERGGLSLEEQAQKLVVT